jgi:hypothetical protein
MLHLLSSIFLLTLWQLHQVVRVDDKLYIVCRLVFGNRASPRCWCAVSGLICWIAIRKFNIFGLHVYIDDFFGWSLANDLVYFHSHLRPCRQVELLSLWDDISCPFEDKKQDYGEVLKIIGFFVDINCGTITLSPDTITDIIIKIHSFLDTADRQPQLCDWQRLGGHLNWLLNVLPWGRPALSELYRKTSGKVRNPKFLLMPPFNPNSLGLRIQFLKRLVFVFLTTAFGQTHPLISQFRQMPVLPLPLHSFTVLRALSTKYVHPPQISKSTYSFLN